MLGNTYDANEKATLERFGNLEDVLDPGFHLKLPWPVDKIYRFKTDEVHSFTLGVVDDNYQRDEEEKKPTRVLLWTQHHNHGSAETPDKNMNIIEALKGITKDKKPNIIFMNEVKASITYLNNKNK